MVEWFYGKEGQQYGPVDEATLRARITSGEIAPQDLIWSEGMDVWTPLQNLPQFAIKQPLSPPPVSGIMSSKPSGQSHSPYAPPTATPSVVGLQAGVPVVSTNGLAIASMICGILGLVLFCFCGGLFLGIPAVICGHLALKQLDHVGNIQQGRAMANAGLICGYISILIFALLMLSNFIQ